jgi:hypothetical protein
MLGTVDRLPRSEEATPGSHSPTPSVPTPPDFSILLKVAGADDEGSITGEDNSRVPIQLTPAS